MSFLSNVSSAVMQRILRGRNPLFRHAGRWDLTALIHAADPQAPRAQRHLWLVGWLQWLRSPPTRRTADQAPQDWTLQRLRLFLNMLDNQPEQRAKVVGLLQGVVCELDAAGLWVDFGFSPRNSFWDELSERLRLRCLPASADTENLGALFLLLFPNASSAQWLEHIDDEMLGRLRGLMVQGNGLSARTALLDALALHAAHVHLMAHSSDLRVRLAKVPGALKPFEQLSTAIAELRQAVSGVDLVATQQSSNYLRALLDECRRAEDHVNAHLDENGISVHVIFLMEQLMERTLRMDMMLDLLNAPDPAREVIRVMVQLAQGGRSGRSVVGLFEHHFARLARKTAQRQAGTGEHYISRTRAEHFSLLRKALLGGAVIAVTTGAKFALSALSLPLFWSGMASAMNYALSFIAVHLMGGTVATKQPAMTAPAMAGKLVGVHDDELALQGFVDEVTHLLRSQFVGILGNLLAVIPVVLLGHMVAWYAFGTTLISPETTNYVLSSHSILGPSALFAAFTGILLWLSGLLGGWAENWFVLHRLESALAWNPRIHSWLGGGAAQRASRWWRKNIAAIASSVALGLLLGLVPVVASFVGLPLEVRHVTLATGQITAAAATLGWQALLQPGFWYAVAAIAVIGACNLGVSFWLAFRLALRARKIRVQDRKLVRAAVWRGVLRQPLKWLMPPAST